MGEFFDSGTIEQLLDKVSGQPVNGSGPTTYIDRQAKALFDSVMKDFHDKVSPEKANGRLQHRIHKLKRRLEARVVKRIVDATNAMIRQSPEFRGGKQ